MGDVFQRRLTNLVLEHPSLNVSVLSKISRGGYRGGWGGIHPHRHLRIYQVGWLSHITWCARSQAQSTVII